MCSLVLVALVYNAVVNMLAIISLNVLFECVND